MSPRGYLDVAGAGVNALRGVALELEKLPEAPTPAQLQARAPALATTLEAVRRADRRLAAIRLSDRRLEAQRAAASRAYDEAVRALGALQLAAEAGDGDAFASARTQVAVALDALRAAAD